MLQIKLDNVGLFYYFDTHRIRTLKDWLGHYAQRWWNCSGSRLDTQHFWALRGVSFELHTGDRLGIVGINGSGKSTLLKVLSGMLRPDAGRVWVRGRTCSLLALGTGFEPDLSGRDNVYLSGILMGMTRSQLDARLEWIIQFAELGDYFEQPLKTYSAGMASRLGFAVACAAEPDILMLDEILSVGDGAFVQKAERALQEMMSRTACQILVNHNTPSLRQQCNKILWLHCGQVRAFGSTSEVLDQYERYLAELSAQQSAPTGSTARAGAALP